MVDFVCQLANTKTIHLVGTGEAGPWVLLATALTKENIDETIVDAQGFSFSHVKSTSDPSFLPGALKYGGLGGLAALAAPANLTVAGMRGIEACETEPLTKMYAATKGKLTLLDANLTPDQVVKLLE